MQRLSTVFTISLIVAILMPHSTQPCKAQNDVSNRAIIHPKGEYVTVNGARLWYESEGVGEPLILISGGRGVSHDYFHPYFSRLRDSYRIIYFDAFGRGKSDHAKDRHGYTLARDVEDVEGLRRALGLGKINVLGHSYGGIVAQSYALRFPDSLLRLILVDTTFSGEMWQAGIDNGNYELRNQFPETWERLQQVRTKGFNTCSKEYSEANNVSDAFLMFYDTSEFQKLPQDPATVNDEVYCSIAGDNADIQASGDLGALDFRPDLKKLNVPMLVITGRYDRVSIPRWAVQYKVYAPQAQFVMFEKSGHWPFIEQTDETMRVLRDFLQKRQLNDSPNDPWIPPQTDTNPTDLAWFLGNWKIEKHYSPNPFMQGKNLIETQQCAWAVGGYYVVCNSVDILDNGKPIRETVVWSHDVEPHVLRFVDISPDDSTDQPTAGWCRIDGDMWYCYSEPRLENGRTIHLRFVTKNTPSSAKGNSQFSEDGTKWLPLSDDSWTKIR